MMAIRGSVDRNAPDRAAAFIRETGMFLQGELTCGSNARSLQACLFWLSSTRPERKLRPGSTTRLVK
jgi:hypothetical protein